MWIQHHGIKGQKWGVRHGPPYPLLSAQYAKFKDINKSVIKPKVSDAHKISKGTIMYRSTTNPNEDNSGSTYVTFRDEDRQHYKGYVKLGYKDKAYEKTFKLKEDLYIPSQEELKEAQKKTMSNPKLKQDAINSVLDFYVKTVANERIDTKRLEDYNKIKDKAKNNTVYSYDKINNSLITYDVKGNKKVIPSVSYDEYKNYREQVSVNKAINNATKDIKDKVIDDFGIASLSMMYSKNFKNAIIKDLSSKGYNAMVDEAGVGIMKDKSGKTYREGTETLIVFDRAKSLEEISTKEISEKEANESYDKFEKWMSKNKYRS